MKNESNLLQRYERDLALKGFSPRRRKTCFRSLVQFLNHTAADPRDITKEIIKDYLYHLINDRKLSPSSLRQARSAICYFFSQTLSKPLIPSDKNHVGNAIRPFVVGRKNWLFSGSPRGARAGARIYSLIETAKANELEPYWYLRFLFEKLPVTPENEIEELLPNRIDQAIIARFRERMG